MHPEIFSSQQEKLLPLVKQFDAHFGLVGGTAIALYLGHRRSIDFDLFSLKPFNIDTVKSIIRNNHAIEHVFIEGKNELTILVDQVKMTFYYFPYPIMFSECFDTIIRLPDLQTLGAMKVFALGKRAKWKDYVDLYYLLQQITLDEINEQAASLFGSEFNQKLVRVQLGYFEDVDYTEGIDFIEGFEVSDQKIKDFLQEISIK